VGKRVHNRVVLVLRDVVALSCVSLLAGAEMCLRTRYTLPVSQRRYLSDPLSAMYLCCRKSGRSS
jgi:hypothetical protein